MPRLWKGHLSSLCRFVGCFHPCFPLLPNATTVSDHGADRSYRVGTDRQPYRCAILSLFRSRCKDDTAFQIREPAFFSGSTTALWLFKSIFSISQRSFTLMVLPTFPPAIHRKSRNPSSCFFYPIRGICPLFWNPSGTVRGISRQHPESAKRSIFEVVHLSSATEKCVISYLKGQTRWLTFTTLRDTTCLLVKVLPSCFLRPASYLPVTSHLHHRGMQWACMSGESKVGANWSQLLTAPTITFSIFFT